MHARCRSAAHSLAVRAMGNRHTVIPYSVCLLPIMHALPRHHWIAVAAHRLRFRWRTIAPEQLEELADTLWCDDDLRELEPERAVDCWLRPIVPNRE